MNTVNLFFSNIIPTIHDVVELANSPKERTDEKVLSTALRSFGLLGLFFGTLLALSALGALFSAHVAIFSILGSALLITLGHDALVFELNLKKANEEGISFFKVLELAWNNRKNLSQLSSSDQPLENMNFLLTISHHSEGTILIKPIAEEVLSVWARHEGKANPDGSSSSKQ